MTSTAREYFTVNLGLRGLHGLHGLRAALASRAARDGLTESDVPLHSATQFPATKQTAKLSVSWGLRLPKAEDKALAKPIVEFVKDMPTTRETVRPRRGTPYARSDGAPARAKTAHGQADNDIDGLMSTRSGRSLALSSSPKSSHSGLSRRLSRFSSLWLAREPLSC